VHGERREDGGEEKHQPTSAAVALPCISPRTAVTSWLTGLASTAVWSRRGIVFGST
jgi:hypothetical protein